MRTLMLILAVISAVSLASCSTPVVESTVPPSSEHHGGILIPLTDNQCYVELLNDKRQKKGKEYETTLVAYLLQADKKSALSEAPSSVQVQIDTPKGEKTVALQPAPDSADPVGSSRFVSTLGPYELTERGGEMTVIVGGKTLTGKFRGPR